MPLSNVDFYLGCSSRRLSEVDPTGSPFETESETDFESDFDDENWSVKPCYYRLAKSISAPSITGVMTSNNSLSVEIGSSKYEGGDLASNRRKTYHDCYQQEVGIENEHNVDMTGETVIGYVHKQTDDQALNNKALAGFAHHSSHQQAPPVTNSLPSPVEERNPAFDNANNSKPLQFHVPITTPPMTLGYDLNNHKTPPSPPVSPRPVIRSKFIEDLTNSLPGSYEKSNCDVEVFAKYNLLPLSTSSSEFFFNRSLGKNSHCSSSIYSFERPTPVVNCQNISEADNIREGTTNFSSSSCTMPRSTVSSQSLSIELESSSRPSFMSLSTTNYCTGQVPSTSSSMQGTTTATNKIDLFSGYTPIAQAPRDNSLIEINLDPVSPLILAATVADSSESLAGLEQQAITELNLETHAFIVDKFHQRPLLDDPEKPFIPASPVFPDIDQFFHETYPELDSFSEEYQYHKARLLRNRIKLKQLSDTLNSREELRRQKISLAKLHGFDQPRSKVKLF